MPSSYPVGLIRTPGETLALSTSLASLGIPPNVYQALLYNPAVDFRLHLNPAILGVYFYDAGSAVGSRFVNLGAVLTDRATGTGSGNTMNSMTSSDFLYICFADTVGGFRGTIGNTNSTGARTTSAKYSKNDNTFAAVTITDGMASATSFDQTGSVTFTVPTDWKRGLITDFGITAEADSPVESGHWLQVAVNGTLDASVSITELWALNSATDRGYFRAGTEYAISLDRRNVGAIEAVLASGSDTLQITWEKVAGM